MPHRIGHFERIYRVADPAAERMLESAANGLLLAEYENALDRLIPNREEVILVKRVHLRCHSTLGAAESFRLARHWGEEMAQAVAKAVQNAERLRDNEIARFPDAAAHAAAFLAAVVNRKDARAWYFRRFAAFLRPSPHETVRVFFQAQADSPGPLLRRLSELGQIPSVLGHLDGRALADLWSHIRGLKEAADPEAARPMFSAAVNVLTRTHAISLSQARSASLWEAYKASGRAPVDWLDSALLADRFVEALRFLTYRLGTPRPIWNETIAAELRSFDWIDLTRVKQCLAVVPEEASVDSTGEMRAMHDLRPELTPRQREWRRVFQLAVDEVKSHLSHPFDSPTNRLLILSAMLRHRPAWQNDTGLPAWIEEVLAQEHPSDDFDAESLLSHVDKEAKPAKRANYRSRRSGIWSAAAGAILLLRGMFDLRAPALGRQCAFPRVDALGTRWLAAALAGKCAGVSVCEDDGLRLLADLHDSASEMAFLDAWESSTSSVADFQMGLYGVALGQRLVGGEGIRIVMMPRAADWLLLAGDESARVWPFAVPVSTFEEAAVKVRAWHSVWKDHLDPMPNGRLPPALAESLNDLAPETAFGVPEHLPEDLEPFDETRIGPPEVDAALTGFAGLALRAWARWLKGFADASPRYLLTQFLRRPGTVSIEGKTLRVELEPAPMDVVLNLSGYLDVMEVSTDAEPFERIEFVVRENDP